VTAGNEGAHGTSPWARGDGSTSRRGAADRFDGLLRRLITLKIRNIGVNSCLRKALLECEQHFHWFSSRQVRLLAGNFVLAPYDLVRAGIIGRKKTIRLFPYFEIAELEQLLSVHARKYLSYFVLTDRARAGSFLGEDLVKCSASGTAIQCRMPLHWSPARFQRNRRSTRGDNRHKSGTASRCLDPPG
jgi:hypothetical protein